MTAPAATRPGAGPCVGCELAPRCKAERLACGAFLVFVGQGGNRYRHRARNPDAETYDRIFSPTERQGTRQAAQPPQR